MVVRKRSVALAEETAGRHAKTWKKLRSHQGADAVAAIVNDLEWARDRSGPLDDVVQVTRNHFLAAAISAAARKTAGQRELVHALDVISVNRILSDPQLES